MGAGNSKLDKALAASNIDERFYGLENFGNTCYCNSVLQALYFCKPFREQVLRYSAELLKDSPENLLTCLTDLFVQVRAGPTDSLAGRVAPAEQSTGHTHPGARTQINGAKKKTGVISPKKFVQRLKRDNELFSGYMHQVQCLAEPRSRPQWVRLSVRAPRSPQQAPQAARQGQGGRRARSASNALRSASRSGGP